MRTFKLPVWLGMAALLLVAGCGKGGPDEELLQELAGAKEAMEQMKEQIAELKSAPPPAPAKDNSAELAAARLQQAQLQGRMQAQIAGLQAQLKAQDEKIEKLEEELDKKNGENQEAKAGGDSGQAGG